LNISGAFAVNAAGLSRRFGAGAFGVAAAGAAGFGVVVAGAAGFGAGFVDVCAPTDAAARTTDVKTMNEQRIVFTPSKKLCTADQRTQRKLW